jgi:trk system potassium uptake protein TrkH
MAEKAEYVSYASRPKVLLKYFGQLSFVLAALTMAPLFVSIVTKHGIVAMRYGMVVAGLALIALFLRRLKTPAQVQTNEGMTLAALSFFFAPLIMSFPMMGSGLAFQDAFFEAISGATTTGLSTLPTVENCSDAFLFARAWMQWYGGLGIMALSLAFVFKPGLAAKGLAVSEKETDDLAGGTRIYARRVFMVYCAITVFGVLILVLLGVEVFPALLYTLASVSTGGFAPHDNSLAALPGWPIQGAVTLICLSCAVPLTWYYQLFRRQSRGGVNLLQLKGILGGSLLLTVLLGFCASLQGALPWREAFRHAPFMVLSANTTAGFSTIEPAQLNEAGKALLIVAMLIGGGLGSTAGGFKILRLLIVMKVLQVAIKRTCLAKHALLEPRLSGQKLDDKEIQDAMLVILLFAGVVGVSWIAFLAMGYGPLDSLFEVISATGTVGLSVGISGPDLPVFLKGVLCADMLLGRLEIVAWLVVLNPGTWFGRRMTQE